MTEQRSAYDVTLQEFIEHVLLIGGTVEIGTHNDLPYLKCSATLDGVPRRDKVSGTGGITPANVGHTLQHMAGFSSFNPERSDGFAPRKLA